MDGAIARISRMGPVICTAIESAISSSVRSSSGFSCKIPALFTNTSTDRPDLPIVAMAESKVAFPREIHLNGDDDKASMA